MDSGYDRGYTWRMKTAISIPDPLFRKADAVAEELKISRSELYRRALDVYLKARDGASVTAQLNQFFDENPDCNGLEPGWAQAQAEGLARDPW